MGDGIKPVFTYGTTGSDITGDVIKSDPFLEVGFSNGYRNEIKTALVGAYNLPNVLAAVAVGKIFGVPDERIRTAIEAYTPSNSRSQLVQKHSNKVILDAYNANPSSMKAAIENFAKTEGDNKILVLGAMAELGEESNSEHKGIIEEISHHQCQHVVLVGGEFLKNDHSYLSF